MEESIIMAVRCPCCDTLLFESDKHKYKAKVSHMQKGIDDNYKISNGQMLMSVEGTNREENYSGLVKRQINYITKVSRAKNSKKMAR